MKQKSSIKQRILEYIDYKGISKYEFYKNTGITRGILDQQNGITETNIIKFVNNYEEISIPWLITGEGLMLKTAQNGHAANLDKSTIKPERDNILIPSKPTIPLIPIEHLTDYLINRATSQNVGFQTNFIQTVFGDADFYTILRDLSLYPLYNSGDVIACKLIQPSDFIQWNKIYLMSTNQGTIVKRILQGKDENHLKMCSDNPTFHAFEISRDEIKAMAIIRGGVHLE